MSASLSPINFVMKSTLASPALPRHVAIIMDGNRRWAAARGRPRTSGHLAGARAVSRTVEGARRLRIEALTLYAFSADNWKRSPSEVSALMRLFGRYLASHTARCAENGIRLTVLGRRDRLTPELRRAVTAAEDATRAQQAMHLRIAIDYSSRDSILQAATRLGNRRGITRAQFAAALADAEHADEALPDVDLLIRTGGEQRLSDFLLWECAYAELVFTPRMWPDFGEDDLQRAVREFGTRERRFGGA